MSNHKYFLLLLFELVRNMINKKARQILFNTFWFENSWVQYPFTSREEFEYAKAAGYMFEVKSYSHHDVLQWLNTSLNSVTLHDVSNAFLSSLSTRRLDLRSALGSFAVTLHFSHHLFNGDNQCDICGVTGKSHEVNLNVLSFERHKWGGVRHDMLEYIAFDLECFAKMDKVQPVEEDLNIMRQILELISQCESHLKPNDLEKKVGKILKSNREERKVLIEILAYCGILSIKNRNVFFEEFVNCVDRILPSVHKVDWAYPACWWSGVNGIDQDSLNYYFPQISNIDK
jgi:hypothetical protein